MKATTILLIIILNMLPLINCAILPAVNKTKQAATELSEEKRQILLKNLLNVISIMPPAISSKVSLKIYGEGVEHRFPPFMERIIQRIQTFFSVYKYSDTSSQAHYVPNTAAQRPSAETLALLYTKPLNEFINQSLASNEIDINLTSDILPMNDDPAAGQLNEFEIAETTWFDSSLSTTTEAQLEGETATTLIVDEEFFEVAKEEEVEQTTANVASYSDYINEVVDNRFDNAYAYN